MRRPTKHNGSSPAGLLDALEEALTCEAGERDRQKIAIGLVKAASRGDLRATELLISQLEGRPGQRNSGIDDDGTSGIYSRLQAATKRLEAMHQPCQCPH